jgi:hypothetical protein
VDKQKKANLLVWLADARSNFIRLLVCVLFYVVHSSEVVLIAISTQGLGEVGADLS